MTLNDDIDRLSRIPLFDGFPLEQLRLLAFGSKRLFFNAGEEIFYEGANSEGGYLVVSGQVDVVVTREGREIVLSSQLENSLIGELALVTHNKTVAGALARTNVELLHIPRELFRRMLSEYPELAQVLHQRIAASVRKMLGEMSRVHGKLSSIPNLAPAQTKSGEPEKQTGEEAD